jgi:hypothetical protein
MEEGFCRKHMVAAKTYNQLVAANDLDAKVWVSQRWSDYRSIDFSGCKFTPLVAGYRRAWEESRN